MWPSILWVLPLHFGLSLAALPYKPENISCIFYYQCNLTCTWSPVEETGGVWYTVRRTYRFGKASDTCRSEDHASCSFFYPNVTTPDNCTIEVEARNVYGMIKSDKTLWSLDNIMKNEPPEISSVQPVLGVKRMIQVEWRRPKLVPASRTLKYTLRFQTVKSNKWMEVNFTREDRHLQQIYNLTGLQAFTEYVLALRCSAKESRFWSDWSRETKGTTEEQAPYGLDLWSILRPTAADGRRPVKLLWKARRGPVLGKTLGYNIRYFPENSTNLTTTSTINQDLTVHLGGEAYWVFVTSYNSIGESPKATLRIPAVHEKSLKCIEVVQTHLTQDQLVVEWQSTHPEVDTWIVEWLPDLESEPFIISWESVSQARNWTAPKDKLKPFLCYNISVYPMFQNQVGQPYSIQAYIKEGVPLEGPVTSVQNIDKKTVTVAWKEIPKSQRNGFIINYTIFCQAEDGEEFSIAVNSSILQYDLEPLVRGSPYTVQVMASTSAGGVNGTTVNFQTLSINVIEIILIASLVGGGLLFLIIPTLAYGLKKPNKLKHLCWPDVPNPAESKIAMWCGEDFQNKLNPKAAQFVNSLSTEDKILKLSYETSDLIDKLVVNSENFLEEVSTELRKHRKNMVGEGKNEYVTSLYTPYCPLRKSTHKPLIVPKILPRKSQDPCVGMPEGTWSEAKELILSSGPSSRADPFCQEGAPNPYLKNSVTTREFLEAERLPAQTKREV